MPTKISSQPKRTLSRPFQPTSLAARRGKAAESTLAFFKARTPAVIEAVRSQFPALGVNPGLVVQITIRIFANHGDRQLFDLVGQLINLSRFQKRFFYQFLFDELAIFRGSPPKKVDSGSLQPLTQAIETLIRQSEQEFLDLRRVLSEELQSEGSVNLRLHLYIEYGDRNPQNYLLRHRRS